MTSKRVFNAYEIGDYESMMTLVKDMPEQQFMSEIRNTEDMPLLHYAVQNNKFDAVQALSSLPYFTELVNDDSFNEGWTPLHIAVMDSTKTDLKIFRYLVDHGA